MNQKIKIITILLFSIWSSIIAQETWTLDECVSFAIEHNLQLNDFEYTDQSNRETYRQSIRDLLPSVNANANSILLKLQSFYIRLHKKKCYSKNICWLLESCRRFMTSSFLKA